MQLICADSSTIAKDSRSYQKARHRWAIPSRHAWLQPTKHRQLQRRTEKHFKEIGKLVCSNFFLKPGLHSYTHNFSNIIYFVSQSLSLQQQKGTDKKYWNYSYIHLFIDWFFLFFNNSESCSWCWKERTQQVCERRRHMTVGESASCSVLVSSKAPASRCAHFQISHCVR